MCRREIPPDYLYHPDLLSQVRRYFRTQINFMIWFSVVFMSRLRFRSQRTVTRMGASGSTKVEVDGGSMTSGPASR